MGLILLKLLNLGEQSHAKLDHIGFVHSFEVHLIFLSGYFVDLVGKFVLFPLAGDQQFLDVLSLLAEVEKFLVKVLRVHYLSFIVIYQLLYVFSQSVLLDLIGQVIGLILELNGLD